MSKHLTQAAIKKHLKSNGCDIYDDGCLYCGHGNIYGDTFEFSDLSPVDNGDMEQEVKCTLCGRKWIDVFRLTEVREIYEK